MTDAPYIEAAALRAKIPDLVGDTRWSDEDLADFIAEFEGKVEAAKGVAYTPRTAVQIFEIRGTESGGRILDVCDRPLILTHTRLRSITSIVSDGTVTLDAARYQPNLAAGIINPVGVWPGRELAVTHVHGYSAPSPALLRANRLFVWHETSDEANPNSGNAYMTTNTDLGIIERASTADPAHGRITGWIDVDRILSGLPDETVPFA